MYMYSKLVEISEELILEFRRSFIKQNILS